MKKLRFVALAIAGLVLVSPGGAASFADIQLWTGSGANQAALVLDWNDGKTSESLVWGYRWDGVATGLDMFQAVVNTDSRLFAHLGAFGFGTTVMGVGYDLDGNGVFGVTPLLNFDGGGVRVDPGTASYFSDARVATDAGDRFMEGWSSGYWSYYLKPSAVAAWGYASSGAADRVLSDGVWDGWSFAPGFADTTPSEPTAATAVPEPARFALLSLSALLLTCVRRKQS